MKQKIIEALGKLDPSNDNHWTAEGQPRLDTMKMLMADGSLTRAMIDEHVPGYTRALAAGQGGGTSTPAHTPAATGSAAGSAAQSPQGANLQGGDNGEGSTAKDENSAGASALSGVDRLSAAEAEQSSVDDQHDDAVSDEDLAEQIAQQEEYLEAFRVRMNEANQHLALEVAKLDKLIDARDRRRGKELPAHLQYLRSRYPEAK